MMGTNPRAVIGGNAPPDQIDEITAAFDDVRSEAENWLDGSTVETEGQMKAVDVLRKGMRDWRIALEAGQKAATAPLYAAYKAEGDRWKPTIEDAKRIEAGLVAAVDAFKRKLAAAKDAEEKRLRDEAWAKTRAAEESARQAAATDLAAQRAADEAKRAAEDAQRAAMAAAKNQVKGMRTVPRHRVTDHRALLNWVARNDRDAITAFLDEYAAKHRQTQMDGVEVWQEKEAY